MREKWKRQLRVRGRTELRLLWHSLASQTRHSSNGSVLFTSTSGVVADKGQLPLSGPVDVAGKVDDAQVDEELCDLADGHCLLPWDADLERREGVVEVCIVARMKEALDVSG